MKIAYVLFGRSQMGKSTFINLLLCPGQAPASVGSGSGRSTTTTVNLYETHLGLLVDVPGYDDSGLRLDLQSIAKMIALELAAQGITSVKFLVFDSIAADSLQIRATVEKLVIAFGERCKSSTVVIASKLDRVDPDELHHRLQHLRDEMADIGIGGSLVEWQSKSMSMDENGRFNVRVIDESRVQQQLVALEHELEKIQPTATAELEDLSTRIEAKARDLFDAQEKTQVVTVTESYVEQYETTEQQKIIYDETDVGATIGKGILGTLGIIGSVGIAAPAIIGNGMFEPTRKQRVEYHDVPVTRERSLLRDVEKTVDLTLQPIENYFEIARLTIIEEARQEFRVAH